MLCRVCKEGKPESEFYQVTNKGYSKTRTWTYYRRDCKGCNNAAARARHVKNRDRDLATMSKHYRANTPRYDYWRVKACAKKRGATQFCTEEEWAELRKGNTCSWCGGGLHPSFTHVDHVIPLCEGGQHTRNNLVLSCANCNMRREWERKTRTVRAHCGVWGETRCQRQQRRT